MKWRQLWIFCNYSICDDLSGCRLHIDQWKPMMWIPNAFCNKSSLLGERENRSLKFKPNVTQTSCMSLNTNSPIKTKVLFAKKSFPELQHILKCQT